MKRGRRYEPLGLAVAAQAPGARARAGGAGALMRRLWDRFTAWLLPIGVLRLTPNLARVYLTDGWQARAYYVDQPWEQVVGMFSNDPVMAEIMDAGQRIRAGGTTPDRTQRLLEGVGIVLGIAAWVMLIAIVISAGHDLGVW